MTPQEDRFPFVTVVIPTLNEERFLIPMLESLGCLGSDRCLPGPHEVIVVDGGSTDDTLSILAGISEETGIRVMANSARIQSAGVNLAAAAADPRSKFLVRVDAHAIYDPGFVEKVVSALVETRSSSVVVPLITRPFNPRNEFAWAVAAAQRSRLGNGGSAHRLESTPADWVDHGHHAGFDIEFFRSIGGYDETFATNEDAEYDVRVHKAGGRIWFEPFAKAWYSPRESLGSLANQYFRYGKGRASTVLKHALRPRLRQLFPVVALFANAIALLGGVFWPPLLVIPLAYLLVCVLEGVRIRRACGPKAVIRPLEVAAALTTMHMSWGAGFTCQVFKSVDK